MKMHVQRPNSAFSDLFLIAMSRENSSKIIDNSC